MAREPVKASQDEQKPLDRNSNLGDNLATDIAAKTTKPQPINTTTTTTPTAPGPQQMLMKRLFDGSY